MATSVLRLDEVPAGDRFDFWWEAVARSVVSVDAFSDRAADFWGEMRSVDLGRVTVSRVRCATFEARRSATRIRHSDPGVYQLAVTVRGRSGITQEGREAALAPTDITLYDTSRPFRAWSLSEPPGRWAGYREDVSEGLLVQFAHDELPLPVALVRRLLARRLPAGDGVGALLRGVLQQLETGPQHLTATDLERLAGVLLDLVTTLLAHELETDAAGALCDPDMVLLLRVQAYVERRLPDADLSPAGVAAAHHISLRQLHRLFQQCDITVGGWIRQRRLERCRRLLADPLLDRLPVGDIGARWGFANSSHFNRIFSAAYGVPPAAYRRQAQEDRERREGLSREPYGMPGEDATG